LIQNDLKPQLEVYLTIVPGSKYLVYLRLGRHARPCAVNKSHHKGFEFISVENKNKNNQTISTAALR
jgi:hypothetical protein